MSKAIPDHSPLIANEVICYQCGTFLKPEIVKNPNGTVDHLLYKCVNQDKGCSYQLKSWTMIQGEMVGIRPDGKQTQIPQ